MTEKQILIGKILSTHGLTGNVKLESFCENPQSLLLSDRSPAAFFAFTVR